MDVTTKIKLDVASGSLPVIVFAKQCDAESRFVEITLTNEGIAQEIPEGTTARIRLTKSDGKQVLDDAEIQNGVIIAELTEQALAADGIAVAEIALYAGSELLTTQIFYIDVKRSAVNEKKIQSADEYKTLTAAIATAESVIEDTAALKEEMVELKGKTETAKQDAEEAAQAALEAASAVADKIDGITVTDVDNDMQYIAKLRVINGMPAIEYTEIEVTISE